MHLSAIAAVLGLTTLGLCQSAQVNFYYDDSCKSYAGTVYVTEGGGKLYGGPYGSNSGMFISKPSSWNDWGFSSTDKREQIGWPVVWSPSGPGSCIALPNVGINAFAGMIA